ncbi:very short patch repair endonuclease [Nitrogeniibacter aestuarii]|uniref:very short patch repair endonuclease n=1 Tax=Nitrogeniibacter aestuarii TaxID=2815343 RepID=UPI001D11BF2F
MADVVDKATRSRMMSGIRGKDTKPELLVRQFLHSEGFRFRLHDKNLPGKPDLVLPKWRTVVLVHGCFWHMHNCKYFKLPSTRTEFWRAKLDSNRKRDELVRNQLQALGWRVVVVHECQLRDDPQTALRTTEAAIRGDVPIL